jgi:hypothetical protein
MVSTIFKQDANKEVKTSYETDNLHAEIVNSTFQRIKKLLPVVSGFLPNAGVDCKPYFPFRLNIDLKKMGSPFGITFIYLEQLKLQLKH